MRAYAARVTIRFTRQQAIDYDRACSQTLGVPSIVLMTHAAVECATIIRCGRARGEPPIIALCGSGNNGGDGYAIVRTLHSWGIAAIAVEVAQTRGGSDARIMRDAAAALGLVHPWESIDSLLAGAQPMTFVDALFGTGLTRPPAGRELDAIRWMNAHAASGNRIFAIDLPSGMNCDTGGPCEGSEGGGNGIVRATQTLTMVCDKSGFAFPGAREFLGTLSIIPIGGPPITQERQTVE